MKTDLHGIQKLRVVNVISTGLVKIVTNVQQDGLVKIVLCVSQDTMETPVKVLNCVLN